MGLQASIHALTICPLFPKLPPSSPFLISLWNSLWSVCAVTVPCATFSEYSVLLFIIFSFWQDLAMYPHACFNLCCTAIYSNSKAKPINIRYGSEQVMSCLIITVAKAFITGLMREPIHNFQPTGTRKTLQEQKTTTKHTQPRIFTFLTSEQRQAKSRQARRQ